MSMGNVSVLNSVADISAAELLNLLADPDKYRKALADLTAAKKAAAEAIAEAIERDRVAKEAEAQAKEAEDHANQKYTETAAAISVQQSQLQDEQVKLDGRLKAIEKREADSKTTEAYLATAARDFEEKSTAKSAQLEDRQINLANRKASLDQYSQELDHRANAIAKTEEEIRKQKAEADTILAAAKAKVAQMLAVLK